MSLKKQGCMEHNKIISKFKNIGWGKKIVQGHIKTFLEHPWKYNQFVPA